MPPDLDLNQLARQTQSNPLNEPREWTVQALYGRGKKTKRLPIRLIFLPLPPEKAEIARKKVRRSGSKRQRMVDPHSDGSRLPHSGNFIASRYSGLCDLRRLPSALAGLPLRRRGSSWRSNG
jgi:hypothetical protein